MSLVDYASSSDDEDSNIRHKQEDESNKEQKLEPPLSSPHLHDQRSISSLHQQPDNASKSSTIPIEKLPDASLLLNLPDFSSYQTGGNDHSARVAAAMAENTSRKRESKGSVSTYPRNKQPRGNLPHTKNVPETVGGLLVPPQLKGRSNVVTEDIGKLFVRKAADPSH